MEYLEIVCDLQDKRNEIGEKLIAIKRHSDAPCYKLLKYQYEQLGIAIKAINNGRMAIVQDFQE